MSTGRKILVLESDAAASFPLGAALRRNGWLVICAADAVMAFTVARKQQPDAVLLNSRLAGGGGLVALQRLRSSAYTTLIPVICIVPSGTPDRITLIDAGAQETIEPPGDPEAIDGALRRYLSRGESIVQVPKPVLAEPSRVAALKESRLLDTAPDDRIDSVTRLAAQLLGAPLARLSIVDVDRQFFKSQVDLSPVPVTLRETPLSNAICQWVAGGGEDLVVSDAREHPVLRTNLAVREDGVRAYAGVPFTLDGKAVLGSFCVVDSKPHPWTEAEISTLRDLAHIAEAYAALGVDTLSGKARLETVGAALISVTRVILGIGYGGHQEERRELGRIAEDLALRLSHLVQPGRAIERQPV